jgi:hypothetical protein
MNSELARTMIVGYIVPAFSVIGFPPVSTSGEWIEVGAGDSNITDSEWIYTPTQSAYTIYKVK